MPSRNWVAYKTISMREIRRFLRIWTQSILPSVITMSLYFIIFGGLIGKRIGNLDGYNYAQYITPGLVMMAVITNSYANTGFSFYLAKFQRNIEELLVSPASNFVIVVGYVTGGVMRGLAVGTVVILVSLFFTHLHVQHWWLMLLVCVMSAALFSLAGLVNAIYADNFDGINFVPTFVLTPLTYLGGVFYSIDMLPETWQRLSHLNPILYMVNTFRFGMLGTSDVPILSSLLVVFVIVLLFFVWIMRLLNNGIGIKS